jgi:hypothetical protein
VKSSVVGKGSTYSKRFGTIGAAHEKSVFDRPE